MQVSLFSSVQDSISTSGDCCTVSSEWEHPPQLWEVAGTSIPVIKIQDLEYIHASEALIHSSLWLTLYMPFYLLHWLFSNSGLCSSFWVSKSYLALFLTIGLPSCWLAVTNCLIFLFFTIFSALLNLLELGYLAEIGRGTDLGFKLIGICTSSRSNTHRCSAEQYNRQKCCKPDW